MEQLIPWLTPALILGLLGWLRFDIRNLRQDVNKRVDDVKTNVNKKIDELKTEVKLRFDEMNQRFDQVNRELGENRERMAKLEGALEGFLGLVRASDPDCAAADVLRSTA